jgi:hypothetical protein
LLTRSWQGKWWACKIHAVRRDGSGDDDDDDEEEEEEEEEEASDKTIYGVTYDNGEKMEGVRRSQLQERLTECQLCGSAGA